jgi:hypothetical protein
MAELNVSARDMVAQIGDYVAQTGAVRIRDGLLSRRRLLRTVNDAHSFDQRLCILPVDLPVKGKAWSNTRRPGRVLKLVRKYRQLLNKVQAYANWRSFCAIWR